jgi:hypothetical protein
MLTRVIGLLLAVIGFLILKYFPSITSHQKSEMTMTGILIGVILILIGIGLMIFG